MLRKFAAALIATSLLATPVLAATAAGTQSAPVTQTSPKAAVHHKVHVRAHKVQKIRHASRHLRRGTHVAVKTTHAKRTHVAKHGAKVVKITKHTRTSRNSRVSRG